MNTEIGFVAALLMGVFGSVHCAGMCSGIACAFSAALPAEVCRSPWRMLPYVLAYNLGRIASYAIAGGLVGVLGSHLTDLLTRELARSTGVVIGALFMVALGLYLGGWWRGLAVLERAGAGLWRRVEPLGRRLLPVDNPFKALAAGGLWGWLPCGLVYSALAWTLSADSAAEGAALMVVFGLGTLPVLLGFGLLGGWLGDITREPLVRRTAGALIIVAGVATLAVGPLLHGHDRGHAAHLAPQESATRPWAREWTAPERASGTSFSRDAPPASRHRAAPRRRAGS